MNTNGYYYTQDVHSKKYTALILFDNGFCCACHKSFSSLDDINGYLNTKMADFPNDKNSSEASWGKYSIVENKISIEYFFPNYDNGNIGVYHFEGEQIGLNSFKLTEMLYNGTKRWPFASETFYFNHYKPLPSAGNWIEQCSWYKKMQ
ncbi:hypothetical protein [Niabella sp.]|uniref:hypothetical protein n=1 Tax=Niabella sp. TaxID=1962976 RepID=UPI0026092EB3|nr:hypothetical protein [Niabella sp.]